jgi:hypothetical protein
MGSLTLAFPMRWRMRDAGVGRTLASLALAFLLRFRVEDAGVDADIGKGSQNEPPNAGVFIALECGERWRKPNASVGRETRTGPIGAHLAERAG